MLNFELHRHERCGTMVLRPVELDAPGYPWTRKAYKSRLDDVLPIEKIVAIDLVKAYVDAAANFRKNHEPQIFIFDMERLPSMIVSLRRDPVNKRQGIHATAAALIYAFLKKHRIRIRRIGQIGEDVDFLLPGFDWTAFSDGSFQGGAYGVRSTPSRHLETCASNLLTTGNRNFKGSYRVRHRTY